ncbi:hypothetical protein D3C72_1356490 [compost metagenome]
MRVASGQLPRQVFGQHQHQAGSAKPGQPEALFAVIALAQQAGQCQHQQLAQGGTQHQGLGGDRQCRVFIGEAVTPYPIELLLGGVYGGEQRRPQQGQCQNTKQGA